MKKYFFAVLFFLLFVSRLVLAQTNLNNAGFVPGPLWFSKFPFFAGEMVRIYTAIYNSSEQDLTGTIEFYKNDELIEASDFSLAKGVGIRDVWIDWKAEKGEFDITAKIKNAKIYNKDGQAEEIYFSDMEAGQKKVIVDNDNDHDGIGNIEDKDDDNDGLEDTEEIKKGTNPFVADNPNASSSTKSKEEDLKNNLLPEKKIKDIQDEILKKIPLGPFEELFSKIDASTKKPLENLSKKKKILEDIISPLEVIRKTIVASSTATTSAVKEVEMLQRKKKVGENDDKTGAKIKNFFTKAYLYLLIAVIFILENKIALFILLFFIIYAILRSILRIIFKWR